MDGQLPAPRSATAHLDRRGGTPVAVVDVEDWLDVATAPAVEALLQEALRGRPQQVAVDLSRCQGADPHGLGVLVRVGEQAAAQGTRLVLTGVSGRVHRVLRLMGLTDLLPVVPAVATVAS